MEATTNLLFPLYQGLAYNACLLSKAPHRLITTLTDQEVPWQPLVAHRAVLTTLPNQYAATLPVLCPNVTVPYLAALSSSQAPRPLILDPTHATFQVQKVLRLDSLSNSSSSRITTLRTISTRTM
jgi:hypothetical protein